MNLDKIFGFLVPKDRKFFPLFNQAADNLVLASELLIKLFGVNDLAEREEYIRLIKEAEHKGDDITHALLIELNGTFITPFDRTEIIAMIKKLDDIMDATDSAAERILIYEVTEFLPEMKEITLVLLQASKELQQALKMLNKPKKRDAVLNSCIIIHKLENKGDDFLRKGLARLFKEEKDPIKLIKYKEILQDLECATDFAEEVANLIEGVILEED